MRMRDQRGAAAVEFAIVLPLLMLLLLGILEFGWMFNQQISLTNAAREAARYYAVHLNDTPAGTVADAQSAGRAAAPTVNWTGGTITITPNCSGPQTGTVSAQATIPMHSLTGMFAGLMPAQLNAKGQTICGG